MEEERKIWMPGEVIPQIPEKGIKYSRLCVRNWNRGLLTAVIQSVIPTTKIPYLEDGGSFYTTLISAATDVTELVVVFIEATVEIRAYTCIDALEDGLKITDSTNRLQIRVVPVVIVDTVLAHREYHRGIEKRPEIEGADNVIHHCKSLGAVVVPVTTETIQQRVQLVATDILRGVVREY